MFGLYVHLGFYIRRTMNLQKSNTLPHNLYPRRSKTSTQTISLIVFTAEGHKSVLLLRKLSRYILDKQRSNTEVNIFIVLRP